MRSDITFGIEGGGVIESKLCYVTFSQKQHQTVIVTYQQRAYQSSFSSKEKGTFSIRVVPDKGYKAGTIGYQYKPLDGTAGNVVITGKTEIEGLPLVGNYELMITDPVNLYALPDLKTGVLACHSGNMPSFLTPIDSTVVALYATTTNISGWSAQQIIEAAVNNGGIIKKCNSYTNYYITYKFKTTTRGFPKRTQTRYGVYINGNRVKYDTVASTNAPTLYVAYAYGQTVESYASLANGSIQTDGNEINSDFN